MKSALGWLGRTLGVLIALVVVAVVGLYFISEARLNHVYNIPVEGILIAGGPAALARGEHLVKTIGLCSDCHGESLAGKVMDDEPFVGRLVAPNLTTGKGGQGKALTDEDYIRAIRHGVRQDGKPLIVMASNYYAHLSDTDLAAIIAYLKSLPPIDNELPPIELGILGRFFAITDPTILTADAIDHRQSYANSPAPGVTAAYGKYLGVICTACHAADLGGKEGEGGGLNLTMGGELARWSEADFIAAMRSGVTPTKRQLDKEKMPWNVFGKMTDDELKAIWLYLKSAPPQADRAPTPTVIR